MSDLESEALARSDLYRLLALGFAYPEPAVHSHIAEGGFRTDLEQCFAACMPSARGEFDAAAAELAVSGSFSDFEADYLRTFQTDSPQPSASLYESDYIRNANKPAILLELGAFYENFGLAVSKDFRDFADALTGELEFMCFLAAKEAQARNEKLSPSAYVRAQRDFLARHLATWIPRFEQEVEKKSASAFYRALARVSRMLVTHDSERLSRAPADA